MLSFRVVNAVIECVNQKGVTRVQIPQVAKGDPALVASGLIPASLELLLTVEFK